MTNAGQNGQAEKLLAETFCHLAVNPADQSDFTSDFIRQKFSGTYCMACQEIYIFSSPGYDQFESVDDKVPTKKPIKSQPCWDCLSADGVGNARHFATKQENMVNNMASDELMRFAGTIKDN